MEPVNELIQTELLDPLEQYLISETPPKIQTEICGKCNKTWASTSNQPTITLLCGHTYHTLCHMVYEYEDNSRTCTAELCEDSTWSITRDISRRRRQNTVDKVDELLEDTLKKKAFNSDLKILRSSIRAVLSSHNLVQKEFKNVKNQLIHRHIHTINQIQTELNTGINNVRKGDEVKNYKAALRRYRKNAASIFRKYHVSFRDLSNRKIIKVGWRMRWVLERHRSGISGWKYGFRIYPGKKIMKDPIQDTDDV